MKKIIVLLSIVFMTLGLTGCNMTITPTKKVEELLAKYKIKDKNVLTQLDSVIEDAEAMTDTQKRTYHELMEKQYENLNYRIKDEKIDGNSATVIVEIEVYDYGKAITESEQYLSNNKQDFLDDNNVVDSTKFLEYKIGKMKTTNDKIKYTINFTLTKKDKQWTIDELSDIDRLKLHGLYY